MMMSAWVVSVRGLSLSSHDVVLGYHLPAGCEPAAFEQKMELSNRISTMKCMLREEEMLQKRLSHETMAITSL